MMFWVGMLVSVLLGLAILVCSSSVLQHVVGLGLCRVGLVMADAGFGLAHFGAGVSIRSGHGGEVADADAADVEEIGEHYCTDHEPGGWNCEEGEQQVTMMLEDVLEGDVDETH